jgi:hypothetical protein
MLSAWWGWSGGRGKGLIVIVVLAVIMTIPYRACCCCVLPQQAITRRLDGVFVDDAFQVEAAGKAYHVTASSYLLSARPSQAGLSGVAAQGSFVVLIVIPASQGDPLLLVGDRRRHAESAVAPLLGRKTLLGQTRVA